MSNLKVRAKEVAAAAFKIVYTDEEAFVKAVAQEHTVANMGRDVMEMITYASGVTPENAVGVAYYNLAETDEDADGMAKELRGWIKTATKQCATLKKNGLPLTLENANHVYAKTGEGLRSVIKVLKDAKK